MIFVLASYLMYLVYRSSVVIQFIELVIYMFFARLHILMSHISYFLCRLNANDYIVPYLLVHLKSCIVCSFFLWLFVYVVALRGMDARVAV